MLLDRLDEHGILDNFRRLAPGGPAVERKGLYFSDSDVYKWMEAAAFAGRLDLLEPVIDIVLPCVRADGYLHTYYDVGPGSPARYRDLTSSHEWYSAGHFVEAALAHHSVTGKRVLLDVACRWADHLCDTFGPGRDQRVDGHPEAELALARLAARTGEQRYLAQAQWIVEQQLGNAGLSIDTVDLAGHAVRALYLASGIAEVAGAMRDPRWLASAERLFATLVDQRSYPTGAVGGRWLGESMGKPYEMPDAMSYAESCAAVAAVQFCRRIWELTAEPRALDQIELLLFNAVPCGVGADGESWFYSQPHAVAEVANESNPWVTPFDYGENMLLSWFPARRHRWFDVLCCPPNLARIFATVDRYVSDIDGAGDLQIHLPLACRIKGRGWDVEIDTAYPDDGNIDIRVHAAPADRKVRIRIPAWAGGHGHRECPADGRVELPVAPEWWETDPRVEGAARTAFLRRGPVVYCVEGIDVPDQDLRDLVVDPSQSPETAFGRIATRSARELHHRMAPPFVEPIREVRTVPYHAWANREPTTMRFRFPRS